MRILFLDDDLNRTKQFEAETSGHVVYTCETADEAIQLLKAHSFELASLDHDLAGEVFVPSDEKSGYEVAKYISKECSHIGVIVHSFNPDGAKNMLRVLPNAVYFPFGSDKYWKVLKNTFAINR
jgi:DNA-binding response OmpR family regulator